ncbi:hypothetical protein ACLB2K_046340 [Fragaria x ananassa]
MVAIQKLPTYTEKKFLDISKEDLELGDEDEVKDRETKQESLLCDRIKQYMMVFSQWWFDDDHGGKELKHNLVLSLENGDKEDFKVKTVQSGTRRPASAEWDQPVQSGTCGVQQSMSRVTLFWNIPEISGESLFDLFPTPNLHVDEDSRHPFHLTASVPASSFSHSVVRDSSQSSHPTAPILNVQAVPLDPDVDQSELHVQPVVEPFLPPPVVPCRNPMRVRGPPAKLKDYVTYAARYPMTASALIKSYLLLTLPL